MSEQQIATEKQQAVLYTRVEPLTPNAHGDLGLKKVDKPLAFAADAHVVPVNTIEFNLALKHFPIIFAGVEKPMPVVVMGMQDGENLFVGDDGHWPEHVYVPAYIRRFPFIFGQNQEKTQLTLCVDRGTDIVTDNPDIPFFEDGKLSDMGNKALEFCKTYHQHHLATQKFSEICKKHDLFTNQQVNMKSKDGVQHVVGTYVAIDEKKLNDLSDEDFLDLKKNGILPFIYMHLISLSNWQVLSGRRVRRFGEPFPPSAPKVQ